MPLHLEAIFIALGLRCFCMERIMPLHLEALHSIIFVLSLQKTVGILAIRSCRHCMTVYAFWEYITKKTLII